MKCRDFRRRYSAWIDLRASTPPDAGLRGHAETCPRCAGFVRTIRLLDEASARARAAAAHAGGGEEREAALALAGLVVEESRRQGLLGKRRGFTLLLAGWLGTGLLITWLIPRCGAVWGPVLETGLLAAGLSLLGIEMLHHASSPDLSKPVPPALAPGAS